MTSLPMVNSELFSHLRSGKAWWLRGDVITVEEDGILFNHRAKGLPKGYPGRETLIQGDIFIMATGFKLSFLPQRIFKNSYMPPNWYLQVFLPQVPSICAINSTYIDAIGPVGN
jgi:hypothetical protein